MNHTVPTESEHKAYWWRWLQSESRFFAKACRDERDKHGESELAELLYETGAEVIHE